jgi:hypothetical protein
MSPSACIPHLNVATLHSTSRPSGWKIPGSPQSTVQRQRPVCPASCLVDLIPSLNTRSSLCSVRNRVGMCSATRRSAADWSTVLFHPSSYKTLRPLIGGWPALLIASRYHQAWPPLAHTRDLSSTATSRGLGDLQQGLTRLRQLRLDKLTAHRKNASWPLWTRALWTCAVFLRTRGLQMSPACSIMVSRIGHGAGSRAGQGSLLELRRGCIVA